MKKIVIALLLLVGCATPEEQVRYSQIKLHSLIYYKDDRTNLCFVDNDVYNHYGSDSHVFANVPCSPEVEVLIKKSKNENIR